MMSDLGLNERDTSFFFGEGRKPERVGRATYFSIAVSVNGQDPVLRTINSLHSLSILLV